MRSRSDLTSLTPHRRCGTIGSPNAKVLSLHRGLVLLALAGAAAVALGGLTALGASHADARAPRKGCPKDSVRGTIGGKKVCLKAGKRCKSKFDTEYHRVGFHCHASGRLTRRTSLHRRPWRRPGSACPSEARWTLLGTSSSRPRKGRTQGPEIVDEQGRPGLVPAGLDGGQATDFRVQSYRGQPVLTWSQTDANGTSTTSSTARITSSRPCMPATASTPTGTSSH